MDIAELCSHACTCSCHGGDKTRHEKGNWCCEAKCFICELLVPTDEILHYHLIECHPDKIIPAS